MPKSENSSPEPSRRGRLDTLPRVRRELVRLYVEARAGSVATQDATRLASILATIARLIEGAELEERLARVEQALAKEAGR